MLWFEALDKKILEYLPDLLVKSDEPMWRHTSFRIGGPAKRMAFPANSEQMVLLLHFADEVKAHPLIIGNGTNLLAPDKGLDRLVINTTSLNELHLEADDQVQAQAGVLLARLADFAQKNGLLGLEFAHGIPGSLGGAVCMNAGAYDGEMKQVIKRVTVLYPDGIRTLDGAALDLGYRHSVFSDHPEAVVLSAVLQLSKGDPVKIRARMEELMARRKASQPLEYPSAGSTFKRPAGYYAGTLIDQCGLKGLTVGGAQVSEKHAGFVINRGSATAEDVLELIRQIQERIWRDQGIRLEPEVKIIEEMTGR